MVRKVGILCSVALSLSILSGCGHSQSQEDSSQSQAKESAGYSERFGKPEASAQQTQPTQAAPLPMQPLQPGQPPQKPEHSISQVPAVQGGQPGSTLPFNQPFILANEEYQFMAARGKNYVGLDAAPAMRPQQGNSYFLVRYQVIHHGGKNVTVPNGAAVHLLELTTNKVTDIDQAATNANVQSGAATGMPNQLVLEPSKPQIQTLVFQVPNTVNVAQLAVLVTDPSDPQRVYQIVRLSD